VGEGRPVELVCVERSYATDEVAREVQTSCGRGLLVVAGLSTPRIEVEGQSITADEAETYAAVLMWAARVARGEEA
jgi:hypothetical protein